MDRKRGRDRERKKIEMWRETIIEEDKEGKGREIKQKDKERERQR